ncbi:hypothetical protein J2S19_003339 [Metabacillus malikii]|uniref:Uncharacterized protein n=1 Tax=Metabacillus malikii TaxID=1504265 RepID=A0ABT9ZJH8_9BACI|nr:hypothetical protein [Metabacillus malikii]
MNIIRHYSVNSPNMRRKDETNNGEGDTICAIIKKFDNNKKFIKCVDNTIIDNEIHSSINFFGYK